MPLVDYEKGKKSTYSNDIPIDERFMDPNYYNTNVHFNRDSKVDKLINTISGRKWEVTYYNSYGDVNTKVQPFDVNDSPNTQQYIKINKLIVYLQNDLAMSKPEELSGEFIINAGFLPKIGDCFLAKLYNGRIGLFNIETVEVNHYNQHDCYTCNFNVLYFLDDYPNIYNMLTRKTIKEVIYYKNWVQSNVDPLMNKVEYGILKDLQYAQKALNIYYHRTFKDKDTKYLLLPTKSGKYIDPFIANFTRKVFDIKDNPEMLDTNRANYSIDGLRYTVLDAIRNRDLSMLGLAERNLGWVPIKNNQSRFNSRALEFQGVTHVIGRIENTITPDTVDISTEVKETDERVYEPLRVSGSIYNNDKSSTKNVVNTFSSMIPNLFIDEEYKNETDDKEYPFEDGGTVDSGVESEITDERPGDTDVDVPTETEDGFDNVETGESIPENTEETPTENDGVVDKLGTEEQEEELTVETPIEEPVEVPVEDKVDEPIVTPQPMSIELPNLTISEPVEKPVAKPVSTTAGITDIRATKQYSRTKRS